MNPRTARHPAVLITLVALVLLGAAAATPWHLTVPAPLLQLGDVPLPQQELPTASAPPAPDEQPPPDDDDTLLTVLLALAAAAVALLLWYVGRKVLDALRDDTEPPPPPDHLDTGDTLPGTDAPTVPLPQIADAVTRALDRLDAAPTTHDAVIAAWLVLEDAAAEHGTRRHPAQTPTEFTQTVLDDTPAPPHDVATLRHLYTHARFTDRPTPTHDVDEARHALTAIAHALDTHDTTHRTP
ncbi:hypothetical protein GCM10023216_17130 [Isoptericola chiayiensis]|uniref:Protein-glutamine gamma-glutamyltransferase-like C-terminal domain-containing protein n=1 Tax=Isoptericola chiayiensis TaxID=579446 RepID=A0ABP8YF36_9MICO|nr:DUF4129 domain-containing protein [Isoptericola chiayiensis]NOV99941.1 hypothetical protein [Isoptericola chiayiensis]